VHLGIILINNQLDAQFLLYIYLFRFSTCFEQTFAHHQESQLYQYNMWYMSLCVGDRPVCRSVPSRPAYRRVTFTRCCIDTIDSPDDEHKVARNMYRIEINVYKRNCTSSWLVIRIIRRKSFHVPLFVLKILHGLD
jgi:hypothetical protein